MGWEELKYVKSQINNAGDVLSSGNASETEKDAALEVLDNWRAAHSYPMHVFYIRLKNVSKKLDKNALIAARLKRVPSILAKLKRVYKTNDPLISLYRMQDIGGCRAVLADVNMAQKLAEEQYIKGELKHKRVRVTDYITKPKDDGYRSIHIIYKYKSDKTKKKRFNDLLVEVQIRSRLQHLWATSVETVGLFTRQAIKSNEGSPAFQEFFKLVSSAFAKIENCPEVPNTPNNEKELYHQIRQKEKELNLVNKLHGWASAMKVFNQAKKKGEIRFFLLELDIPAEKLTVHSYTKKEEQIALNEYATLEKRYTGNKEYDVVLVGVDAAHDLEKAYPNYYADTHEFLSQLRKIMASANGSADKS